jgi:enoyl-CoA hydratase/carnithine racemase
MPTVMYELQGHVAHLRLNRPEKRNALTMELLRTLGRLHTEVEADPAVRCVLVSANGPDFTVGADPFDVAPAWARGEIPFEPDGVSPWDIIGRKRQKPLVSVVHGMCYTGGFELALASDVCVAADDTRFALTEVRLSTYPAGGGVFRFVRAAGWASAMRYILTGDELDAAEALRLRAVSMVVPRAQALETGLALARKICRVAPLAAQAALAHAQLWRDEGDATAIARIVPDIMRLLNTEDAAEVLRAHVENREPVFHGR